MPLTQAQIDAITELLDGEGDNLEILLNKIGSARDDVRSLLRIHADITDANATTVLANAKVRAKTAAEGIVTKLS